MFHREHPLRPPPFRCNQLENDPEMVGSRPVDLHDPVAHLLEWRSADARSHPHQKVLRMEKRPW